MKMAIRLLATIVLVFSVLVSFTLGVVRTYDWCPKHDCGTKIDDQLFFQSLVCICFAASGLGAALFSFCTLKGIRDAQTRIDTQFWAYALIVLFSITIAISSLVYIGFSAAKSPLIWAAVFVIILMLHISALLSLMWIWYPYEHLKWGGSINSQQSADVESAPMLPLKTTK